MIKELLKTKEPVIYQSLSNALHNQQMAQCFLLAGPKNPLKLDTAFLLAQTLIEGKNEFACETCNTCRRVKALNYYDLKYIDGQKEKIKIETIDELLEEFNKTPLEAANKQVYIINNINNASVKVLNAILKFMEEPPSPNVYGIIITDQLEGLLPTIVSRCQTFVFSALNIDELKIEYQKTGMDELDAYFLANIFKQYVEISADDKNYLHAKDSVLKTIEYLKEPRKLALYYYVEGYGACGKNSDDLDAYMNYYLSLMVLYCNDAIDEAGVKDRQYENELQELRKYAVYELLKAFVEALDKSRASYDRKLLFDQLAYRLTNIL